MVFVFYVSCLSEEADTGTILPLSLFNTDLVRQNPRDLDKEVGWYDQCYYNLTLYVASRPIVGLFHFTARWMAMSLSVASDSTSRRPSK